MEQAWKQLIAGLPNPAMSVEASGVIVEANEHATELLGWSRAELTGLTIEALVPPRFRGQHLRHRTAYLKHPESRPMGVGRELTALRRDGSEVPVEISLIPLEPGPGPRTLAILVDVTQRKRMEAERDARERMLRHQALHDSLTGLANRAMLYQSLRESVQAQRNGEASPALLHFSLAMFRQVNRTYGNRTGDAVLRAAGERLRDAIPGALVARLGSDEFAALTAPLPGGEEEAVRLAEAGRDALGAVEAGDRHYPLGAYVGAVLVAEAGGDPEVLLALVDAATQQAKVSGGGRTVIYNRALSQRLRAGHEMERDLRVALQDSEIWVAYQPIVKLDDGAIVGFEALARWRHPAGDIPPDTFIPIAERSGLIHTLGERVLGDAALRAARWQELDGWGELEISVNASAPQIESDEFASDVAAVLDRTGLAPSTLCLEITETALLHDIEVSGQRIRDLHDLGVQVALDDFGTGYSSLSHWVNLGFDSLKMDRSFIARIVTDRPSAALVRALAGACPEVGSTGVAEGVEEPEQAEMLRDMGVEQAQGYLFGRPMPAAQAGELLEGDGRLPA